MVEIDGETNLRVKRWSVKWSQVKVGGVAAGGCPSKRKECGKERRGVEEEKEGTLAASCREIGRSTLAVDFTSD